MSSETPNSTGWFKSSHSSDAAACVEIKFDDARVLVRDSKYQGAPSSQPTLTFSTTAWSTFIATL
ncbi:DUF397 domain-containing protein [Nocardia sp. CA-128927]|uniref:DUF397 domain-containing protein n=1 Tax=Nocardia sp. CA-128927 TaxID=3239975 RepID=UPI003D9987CF